ncbi:MAG: PIG-L family deacetylase [Opitutaceae bacterium]|nr:PIG-L family deacetylase [Opitutaceae bacterium]
MNLPTQTICLVSGSHLCSNPRLVKEADALVAAGYRVLVVAGRNYPPNDAFDASILEHARWAHVIVDYQSGLRPWGQRVIRRLARLILRSWPRAPLWLAFRAHHPAAAQLSRAAQGMRADLYIGHTLVGLIAAAAAARRHQALLGFDAEDFHPAETEAAVTLPEERNSIRRIELALLPRCCHLTAASPLIGEAYRRSYGLPPPVTVQNVFSRREAPTAPAVDAVARRPARFYWVSQTIGPGRGLEPMFAVFGRMRTPVVLSLRGSPPASDFADRLRAAARAAGFGGELRFLPPAPPEEMARLAAEHDVGLAVEPPSPPNREICLANKIYTYLLAGVPIACTPTSAHRRLAADLGAAALLVDPAQPEQAANELDALLANPVRYRAARHAAWQAGQTRYNWEAETPMLLDAVAAAFRTPAAASRFRPKELGRRALRLLCAAGLRLRSRPLPLTPRGTTLVLAPHADDEALGCGALLAARIAAGLPVHVAYFTDGAAGGSPESDPAHVAGLRRGEAQAAMATLGLDAGQLHFLGAPDGRVRHFTPSERSHWQGELTRLLERVRPAEVLLPSRDDGSSEHEAMFALFAAAVAASGLQPRVLEFPVWSWWNPRFLWRRVASSNRVWRFPTRQGGIAKRALLRHYHSQVTTSGSGQGEPKLSPVFLAAFETTHEFFLESKLPT